MNQYRIKDFHTPIELRLPSGTATLRCAESEGAQATLTISLPYAHVYGLGEKFDCIDHAGMTVESEVVEKFCNQGERTYCSVPFFFTDSGFGLYVGTKRKVTFTFDSEIRCMVPLDAKLTAFSGSPDTIVRSFTRLFGEITPPPDFAFGPWVSANHWKREADVRRVLRELDEYDFPATVLVLEAWSDEATFYIWNGARYTPKGNGEAFCYEDFDFSESPYWKDPKGMIARLAEKGIRLVLWQIPAYRKLAENETNEQNRLDAEDAIARHLCVFTEDGAPYRIPDGNWFEGSLIPDFTKEETKETWFKKRKYLLDLGVAGFKTDGGEFIYRDDLIFSNGDTGKEQKNAYCQTYIRAYHDFIGRDRVLFSRAGYSGAQTTPILWAGDHESTNDELKHVYYAAISAACSGILFWSFDIGGFAGALPTADLYLRSTMFACFVPIMQWHSEPDGGQFPELYTDADGNNERSPWNIARATGDDTLLAETRYFHKLRMKLLPYIIREAKHSAETGTPMMRPLFFDAPTDAETLRHEDEYYFGQALLVAPLLEENQKAREVYLPKGSWIGFFSGKSYMGGQTVRSDAERFPVFFREEQKDTVLPEREFPFGQDTTIHLKEEKRT